MEQELMQGLGDFVKGKIKADIFPAKVIAYNAGEFTIDVEDLEGNELFDIRLTATNAEKGFLIKPKIDSYVLVEAIGGSSSDFCVVMFSQVELLEVGFDDVAFHVEQDGVYIAKGGEDLKTLLSDLLDAIKLITVTTPAGPSGTPINFATFDSIKVRLNSLLK